MSHAVEVARTGRNTTRSRVGPVYIFDLVEDRPDIGGVAAVSRRLREALAERLGPRLVSVRGLAASLGCGDAAEDYLVRERRAILRLAERDPASTFLIPNFQNPLGRQAGRPRPRIVNIVHDTQFAALTDLFTQAQRAWLGSAFAETRANADAIAFVSRTTRDDFHRLFGAPVREAVIPAPLGRGPAAAPAMAAVAGEAPYLLAVQHGDHHPHKNVEGLLGLFAGLADRFPDLGLVVAGRGGAGFLAARERLPERLRGRARHLGFVPRADLAALYRGARAFVSLSRFEGFNMPAAEAACHGTPLILSDLPVHRELHAAAACLLDPVRPDVAAAARYLERDAERLRGRAWPGAEACSAEVVADAYAGLIAAVEEQAERPSWRLSPTTRVLGVGMGRKRPNTRCVEPARAAVRRGRLARALLAGTVLGGSAALGVLGWTGDARAQQATTCTANNAAGGNGGAASDGGAGGTGGPNAGTGLDGGPGSRTTNYYGGGGGGAGGDCLTPMGGKGGASGNAAGGVGGANPMAAQDGKESSGSDGGTGGGGGYYGGTLTGTGTGFSGGAGGKGGDSFTGSGSGGAGGGGGGGMGTGVTGSATLSSNSLGGAGGTGGRAAGTGALGAGGNGGAGGIGTAVFGDNALTINAGVVSRGGDGGAGGASSSGSGGSGAAGGTGLLFTAAGSTLDNNGQIIGGAGGAGGTGNGGVRGAAGVGGIGVIGNGLVIINAGTITGGLAGDGNGQAAALDLTGGTNALTITARAQGSGNGSLDGNINVEAGTLTIGTYNESAPAPSVTIGNKIVGAGAVIVSGPNLLALTGTNTYAGGTTLTGGTLQVSTSTNLDTGSSSIGSGILTFDSGTLQAAPSTDRNNPSSFTFGNATTLTARGGTIDANGSLLILNGTIRDDPNASDNPGTLTISDSTGNGPGAVQLTARNYYSGATSIDVGILDVFVGTQSDGSSSIGSGTLVLNGGVLRAGTTLELDNPVTISGSSGVVDTNGYRLTLGGAITEATTNTLTHSLYVQGGGTLILSSNDAAGNSLNTYSGGTTIDGAAVQLGAKNAIGSGSLTLQNNGLLDLAGNSQAVTTLTGSAGSVVADSGVPGQFGYSFDLFTVASGSFAGAIQDDGPVSSSGYYGVITLDKVTDGTLVLAGGSYYSGGTFIDAGLLSLQHATTQNGVSTIDAAGSGPIEFRGNGALEVNLGNGSGTLATPLTIDTGVAAVVEAAPGTNMTLTGNLQVGVPIGSSAIADTRLFATQNGTTLQIGSNSDTGTVAFGQAGSVTISNPGSTTFAVEGGTAQAVTGDPTLGMITASVATTQVDAGVLDFNGNAATILNLQGNGGTVTNTATTTIDGGAYAGVITGAGALIKDTSATLVLTGANTYSGGTTVTAGTLQIGAGGGTGSIIGDVVDNAALTFARSDAVTYGGGISGAGSLTQAGTGTLTLTGTNTYTGGTTVSAGTLQVGAGGTAGSITGDVVDDGALVFARSDTVTFGGAISGTGSLTQAGTGTLNLTGTSTYTGATAVGSGRLAINGSLGNTAVSVASGATLGGSGTIAGGVTIADGGILAPGNSPGVLTVGSLTLTPGTNGSTGSVLNYELGTVAAGNGPTSDRTDVTGNLVLAGTLNVTDAGGFTFGSYRIFNYGGALTNDGLAVGTLPAGYNGVVQTIIPNQVNLVVASPTNPVQFWDGPLLVGNGTIAGGTGTWTNRLTNWTDPNGVNNAPWSGGIGIFAGAAGTVTVADTIGFQGLQFTTDGYTVTAAGGGTLVPTGQAFVRVASGTTATIAAPLTGTGGILKLNNGTLVLAADNSYTGGTTIGEGTLQLGNGGAAGSVAGNITDNAALVFDHGAPVTYGGVVSGSGALTQAGAGALTLTGVNTYSGLTTISAGTTLALGAGGSIASSSGVQDDGTLDLSASGGASLASLSGRGAVALGAQTLTLTNASGTFSGGIGGSGSLVLQAGTQVLTGTNSYTGGTTIAGGTLQIGDGGTTGTITGDVVDRGTLAFVRSDDVAFAGGISGSGGVVKGGAGTLTLSSTNTYAGGTQVQAGTLAVGSDAALGTGTLSLADGTRLRAAAAGVRLANAAEIAGTATVDTQDFRFTLAGPVSGSGTLAKTGGGTLALTGTNSYAGGTLLRQGTLAIGNGAALGTGRLSMDDGTTLRFAAQNTTLGNAIVFTGVTDPTIDTGAYTATLSGTISGAGALTKAGSGTLVLAGADRATGGTTVAAGTLDVEGSVASAVVVQDGATLSGTGTVGRIGARAGATVSPGSAANPYGVLRTPGSAVFAQGATYRVAIDATGQSSALAVGGTATLGGAGVTVSSAPGTYNAATRYTILTATGGVQGVFGTLSTAEALAFLNPYLSYGGDSVTLAFRTNGTTFADVAVTPNERSVAGALQSLDPDGVLVRSLQGLSPDAARRALDALAGATHASVVTTAAQDARRVSTQILDRLWNIGGGDLDARTLLQQLDTPRDLPAFVNCFAPMPAAAPAAPPTVVTAWGEGFGDFGHDGADRNGAGLDRSLGGFIVGYDAPLHGLGAPYRVGVAGGYTNTSFSGSGTGGSGSAGSFESIFGSVYGGARYGAVDIRLGAAVAGNSSTVNRTVSYPGFNEGEHSVYGGNTEQVFGEVGYRFSGTRWVAEPVADAAYIHVHQDGFRERGGAAALVGSAQDNDVGTVTLGARGEIAPLVGVPLVARAFLGWRHAFGDIDPTTRLAFQAGSLPFTSQGTALDRDALATEAGLDWRFTGALTLGVAYIGQVGARDSDNGVKGRMEYKF